MIDIQLLQSIFELKTGVRGKNGCWLYISPCGIQFGPNDHGKGAPRLQGVRKTHFIFRKLITEASRCQQLKHYNIVQFYGMVLANEKNEVWLAMELLDGSLDTFLHNTQYEIPFETQIKILRDAANGMEHVAREGFVHRDLACRNIIYSVDNAG